MVIVMELLELQPAILLALTLKVYVVRVKPLIVKLVDVVRISWLL